MRPFSGSPKTTRSLRAAKWTEFCLWAVGFAALGYCGFSWADAQIAQRSADREFDRSLHTAAPAATVTPHVAPKNGGTVGRVEIPRLKVSVMVFEGTDDAVLRRGVGHLEGSALPGQVGNVVLAAHRDTFFRPLRNIHVHDIVDVETPSGNHRYEVQTTRIVAPEEVGVLAPTPDSELTLVTCYPFYYIGHAPKRFIVRAKESSTGGRQTAAAAQ